MTVSALLCLAAAAFGTPDPDPAFSPGFFWMWNDRLDEKVLIAQLDDMRGHGIRSVCIHPFPQDFRRGKFESRMTPDYLTDAFCAVFSNVVARARNLGMDVWLYDEGGWPSGGANGKVVAADAEGRFRIRSLKLGFDSVPFEIAETESWRFPPYPSMIEKGATESFLKFTHERYSRCLGSEFGKTVRFAFTDEPEMPTALDWENTKLAWTSDFDAVFRAKKGYDLRPFVPELMKRIGESDDRLAKLRIDYNDVRADLFVERYLKPVREWCREHKLLSGGHLNGENTPENHDEYGHGDLLRSLRTLDCPGVDVIWHQLLPPGPDRAAVTHPFPRYAASAMHLNGGRFAVSESFAIFGDSCTPQQMKWIVDYQLVRGINRFVLAYYALSNARKWMILFEPHIGPVTPYWDYQPPFFRYIERTASYLAEGRPGAEIAVYFDNRGLWAGGADRRVAANAHFAAADALDRLQRDYDFVDDRSLSDGETEGASIRIGVPRYRALVLPTSKWMSPAARQKVEAFKKAGGIVVGLEDIGRTPATVSVRGRRSEDIRAMKRVRSDSTVYFLVNESLAQRTAEIEFPERAPVSRYDVESERRIAVPSDHGKVTWNFDGGESVIFVVGPAADVQASAPFDGKKLELAKGWTLRRTRIHEAGEEDFSVRPLDEPARPTILGDWREQLGESFCGEGVYRVEFDATDAREALLDLGKVYWCAGVTVNGEDLGKRFFGPYRWPVQLRKGKNVLEVSVVNLLSSLLGDRKIRNRLVEKYPPNATYEMRQGKYDLENREGGLYGPVAIKFKK